ncbi:MAG: DUF2608 domain-containing protein [bacterium]
MSQIIEHSKIIEITSYVRPETLVLFDIDNTLIQPVQVFGGHAWFHDTIKRLEKRGLPGPEVQQKASEFFTAIQDSITLKLVEPEIITVLAQLKEKNIKMMGLTARWLGLAQRTSRDLQEFNIVFDNPVHKDNLEMGKISGFHQGILYSGEEFGKGELLAKFLDRINHIPKHVLFVDDVMHYVQDVAGWMSKRGIDCHCIRYGAVDQQVAQYSQSQADKELIDVLGIERFKSIFGEGF